MSVSDVMVLGSREQRKNGSQNCGVISWCVGHFANTNDALNSADPKTHSQAMIQMGSLISHR